MMASNLAGTSGTISKVHFIQEGHPVSLQEFSENRKFPCVLKVNEGQTALAQSFSFGSDQGHLRIGPVTIPVGVDRLFIALQKKTVDVVFCKDLSSKRSSKLSFPVSAESVDFELFPNQGKEWQPFDGTPVTVIKMLRSRSLPGAVRAKKAIKLAKGKPIPEGSLLFPQKVKSHKKGILTVKREDGCSMDLSHDCAATFSVDSSETRMSLALAAKCLKLPCACTMTQIEDECSFQLTVEEVKRADVLVTIMKMTEGSILDDVRCSQQKYDVPVCIQLNVTHMVPEEVDINTVHSLSSKPEQESLYMNVVLIQRQPSNSCDSANEYTDTVNQVLLPTKSARNKVVSMPLPSEPFLSNRLRIKSRIAANDPPQRGSSRPVSTEQSTPGPPASGGTVEQGQSQDDDEHIYSSAGDDKQDEDGSGNLVREEDAEERSYESVSYGEDNEYDSLSGDGVDYESVGDEAEYISADSNSDPEYDYISPEDRSMYANLKPTPAKVLPIESSSIQQNLSTMDCRSVVQLLGAMNLSMHASLFEDRQIDGKMLSSLSNEDLQELGIQIAIHRLRLLHVIRGKKSVEEVLENHASAQYADSTEVAASNPTPPQESCTYSTSQAPRSQLSPTSPSFLSADTITKTQASSNLKAAISLTETPTTPADSMSRGTQSCVPIDSDVYSVPKPSAAHSSVDSGVYSVPKPIAGRTYNDDDVYSVPKPLAGCTTNNDPKPLAGCTSIDNGVYSVPKPIAGRTYNDNGVYSVPKPLAECTSKSVPKPPEGVVRRAPKTLPKPRRIRSVIRSEPDTYAVPGVRDTVDVLRARLSMPLSQVYGSMPSIYDHLSLKENETSAISNRSNSYDSNIHNIHTKTETQIYDSTSSKKCETTSPTQQVLRHDSFNYTVPFAKLQSSPKMPLAAAGAPPSPSSTRARDAGSPTSQRSKVGSLVSKVKHLRSSFTK